MFDCIYLHIGLDKTGSKAIQFACCENAKTLLQAGIFYPVTPDTVWHAEFASFFHDNPKDYDYNRAIGRSQKAFAVIESEDLKFIKNLEQKIGQTHAEKMVLSYEGFAALDAITLMKIKQYLSGISKKIKIILYCREPVSYASSAVSQRAMSMILLWENVPLQFYNHICEKFIAIFGQKNMIVRDFSKKALLKGDVRVDFFKQIGFDLTKHKATILSTEGENRSLSSEAILIAQALRRRCLQEKIPEAEFNWRYAPILKKIKGKVHKLSVEQQEQVRLHSQEQIDYLYKNFAIDFSANVTLKNTVIAPPFSVTFADSIADIICNPVEFTAPLIPEVKSEAELACKPFLGSSLCLKPILTVKSNQKFILPVEINNRSDFHWLSNGLNPIYLSYHWQLKSGEMVTFEGLRTPFFTLGLRSGQSLKAQMDIISPFKTGCYELTLTLVKEDVCWLETHGFNACKLKIDVS
ncbi:MAG: hypothetical protein KAG26_00370 [Methylococcales bacterium]|nr:hypothetical protein [Methylococcales bacterium]